jgi:hypothetical protein
MHGGYGIEKDRHPDSALVETSFEGGRKEAVCRLSTEQKESEKGCASGAGQRARPSPCTLPSVKSAASVPPSPVTSIIERNGTSATRITSGT